MPNKNWSKLKPQQLGRYAEYYAKMEFASYGFEIYSSEVDDHGVDFIAKASSKKPTPFYEVQVKSIRGLNYIFLPKNKFVLSRDLLAVIIIFIEEKSPQIYLIPSSVWQTSNALFVSHDYVGKKSPPEWGLNLSTKNLPLLAPYSFDKIITTI